MKYFLELQDPVSGRWETMLEYYDLSFALQEKAYYEKEGFKCNVTSV